MKALFRPLNKWMNLLLLLAGFGLGQGVLFIVQTGLLATGNTIRLGWFGITYTMGVLAFQVIDWGGLVVLARRTLSSGENEAILQTAFWSLSTFRVAIAIPAAIIAIWIGLSNPGTFWAGFTVASAPFLIVNGLSAGGILDGTHRSGWTGVTSAIPILLAALVLWLTIRSSPYLAGLAVGGTFGAAMAATVGLQHLILACQGVKLTFIRPHPDVLRGTAMEGWHYLLAWAPSQLFYRGQLTIAGLLLGPIAMAYVVYAKQIVNGFSQFLYFVRRTEFPSLVQSITKGRVSLPNLLKIQKIALAGGAAATLILAPLSLTAYLMGPHEFQEATLVLFGFSWAIFSASAYGAINQIFIANKRSFISAKIGIPGNILTLAATAGAIPIFGVLAIPMLEILGHIFMCSILSVEHSRYCKSYNL